MMNIINFALFGFIIIVGAHGASVAGLNKCSAGDNELALECRKEFFALRRKTQNLDDDNREEMKKFKNECDKNFNCTENFRHCPAFQDEQLKRAMTEVKTSCTILNFVSEEFKDCERKLDEKKPKCYDEWNPFQNDKDLYNTTDVQKTCKIFFGTGNCLKQDIVETCSLKDWEKIRDMLLSINDAVKQCDFKGI